MSSKNTAAIEDMFREDLCYTIAALMCLSVGSVHEILMNTIIKGIYRKDT